MKLKRYTGDPLLESSHIEHNRAETDIRALLRKKALTHGEMDPGIHAQPRAQVGRATASPTVGKHFGRLVSEGGFRQFKELDEHETEYVNAKRGQMQDDHIAEALRQYRAIKRADAEDVPYTETEEMPPDLDLPPSKQASTVTDQELEAEAHEDFAKALIQRAGGKTPDFISKWVTPAVAPTVGGVAGNVLGARFGGMPGAVVGGAIGSGIGEGVNQLMGVTEPSMTEMAKATGVPLALGGAAAAIRPLMPFMTSGKAAQTLNALAPEEAAGKVGAMMPKVKAADLFKMATEAKVTIPMNRTMHMIDSMLSDLTNVSTGVQKANSQVIGYLKGLKNTLTTAPSGLSPLALQRELEGAGNVVKSVVARGGTGSGSIKQTFKAMVNDLDDAAKMGVSYTTGAKTLLAARDAFKKESVVNEIGEAITDATKNLRGQGEFVQFNANAVLKAVSKNPFYEKALSATERGEVESLLKLLNKIPALRPGAGAQFGSGRLATMAASATAMGGAGFAAGGATGGGIGTAVGMAIPPMVDFGKNVAVALQMSTGRALMKELLTQSKGVATPQVASVIAAYARAVEASPELGQ